MGTALLTAVLALPVLAQPEFHTDELAELLSAGQEAAAFDLAREHRAQYEGEVEFDYYYGVAALSTGHLGEAVFALERVVMQRPEFFRARLEFARAHDRRGDHEAALEQLDFILAREPPSSVRSRAEALRQSIRERHMPREVTARGYLEIGYGHDSNVASASGAGTVDSVYGPIELERHGGADVFARIRAGLDLRRRLTPQAALLVQSAMEVRPLVMRGDYRTRALEQRLGVETYGERTRTRVTGHWHWSYVGGDLYRKRLGIRTDHAYRLSSGTVVAAGTRISRLRHPRDPNRDSTVGMVSASSTRDWKSDMRPTTRISIFAGEEWPQRSGQAAAAVADRQIWGLNAAMRVAVSREWRAYAGLYYRFSRYGRSLELFDRKRRERYSETTLRLERRTAAWRVGPQLRVSRNEANLKPYDFRRTVVELQARYDFH